VFNSKKRTKEAYDEGYNKGIAVGYKLGYKLGQVEARNREYQKPSKLEQQPDDILKNSNLPQE